MISPLLTTSRKTLVRYTRDKDGKEIEMAKLSIKLILLGVVIAFALAGCAPFGCLLR